MKLAEGLRGEALLAAFEEAVGGRTERLYVLLGTASGLPGARANMTLAGAFAVEVASRGGKADALAFAMAELSADVAPGASSREFLPVCGVLSLGMRAAVEPKLRKRTLALLHEAAGDVRFRVREAVPPSLARIGHAMGDALMHEAATWTDGFFQAAAVLLAMNEPAWLPTVNDVDATLARLDEAYLLAKGAPRATWRYPGWKALVDALSIAPAAATMRFGVTALDQLARWANTEMPELRGAIEANLRAPRVASRYTDDVARVRAALEASLPPPRDPTLLVKGTRGRGKKRGRSHR